MCIRDRDQNRALKLKWTRGNFWIGSTIIPEPKYTLEYKIFVDSTEDEGRTSQNPWENDGQSFISVKETLVAEKKWTNGLQDLKLLSFNVRYRNDIDGDNSWDHRKKDLVNLIKSLDSPIVCLQEADHEQMLYINENLTEYGAYGRSREQDKETGETVSIMYNHGLLSFIQGASFALGDDPKNFGTKTFGNTYPRMCTWALLRTKTTGNPLNFLVVNTHLDNVSAISRRKGLELILNVIGELPVEYDALFLTGDFNAEPDDSLFELIRKSKVELVDTVGFATNPEHKKFGTYNHFLIENSTIKIDYIFFKSVNTNFKCSDFRVIRERRAGGSRFISDHFPIIADFTWQKVIFK
eukprot:TRINITY_DN487_c0_g6_i1.p1 TRINITY_DN487_c0_g6~~TRINITY_DN487_c0_g6_i1.p1  ORF type:complete len:362 (+),score=72.69 TRINITY_DN487_c0_g6_i1:29-1087(+)